MDAIKKKMQSLKTETENLMKNIAQLEENAKEANDVANQGRLGFRKMDFKLIIGESGQFWLNQ